MSLCQTWSIPVKTRPFIRSPYLRWSWLKVVLIKFFLRLNRNPWDSSICSHLSLPTWMAPIKGYIVLHPMLGLVFLIVCASSITSRKVTSRFVWRFRNWWTPCLLVFITRYSSLILILLSRAWYLNQLSVMKNPFF